ncbi:ABC-2 type transport system ATP-binding protein [Alkalibacillus filiformis]|uniref:ABC-2 type transport system ATP-binding protein n=1 Tax=Alkalibacillus filiformis TaxID=200990 RepID=A0ABU0DX87_9BACI|nr:ABC transporter ATP-binding protein [Alkalibacillus filiformis]MDQ0353073.1 ABC-2 type transport system ATP-binding protein [Alkalibacillus filiformis]
MIEVKNVTKSIHKNDVLNHVQFNVRPGTITGVVGRNGAGKTTLLRIISGIIKPDSGEVFIANENIFSQPRVKRDVVFVPDSTDALKAYSIKEIVKFYKEVYPNFDETYYFDLLEKFQFKKSGKIKQLSKGQKALFSLILAFSTNAKYILLDEPTDGLDVIIKREILKFIAEEVANKEVSIMISSHRLDELEKMADHIVVLKEGTVNSELEMETLKEDYRKIQVAYQEQFPEDVLQNLEVLSQNGRVGVVLLEADDAEGEAILKNYEPILYEELPLSLEDIFVTKLGGELYVS